MIVDEFPGCASTLIRQTLIVRLLHRQPEGEIRVLVRKLDSRPGAQEGAAAECRVPTGQRPLETNHVRGFHSRVWGGRAVGPYDAHRQRAHADRCEKTGPPPVKEPAEPAITRAFLLTLFLVRLATSRWDRNRPRRVLIRNGRVAHGRDRRIRAGG